MKYYKFILINSVSLKAFALSTHTKEGNVDEGLINFYNGLK